MLEVVEGTPDLGITSYWTDADGNVVFDPNTPKERRITSYTGAKTHEPEDCGVLVEEKEEEREDKYLLDTVTSTIEELNGSELEAEEETADHTEPRREVTEPEEQEEPKEPKEPEDGPESTE